MLSLDHVALEVSDMDAAIAFYTQKIGLSLISDQVDSLHHERFAYLELAGGNLELLQTLDEEDLPKPMPPIVRRASNCPHVAIGAPDLASVFARLKKEGVEILEGPNEIPGQVRWFYAVDLDGNVLEFVQWLR